MENLTLDISTGDLGPERGPVWVSWCGGTTSQVTLRTDQCNLQALTGVWEETGRPGLGSSDGSHSLCFRTSWGKKGTFLKLQADELQGNVPGWIHSLINIYLLKYLFIARQSAQVSPALGCGHHADASRAGDTAPLIHVGTAPAELPRCCGR